MLVLLLILLPLAAALLILGIRLLRPGFTHHWLLAVLGSLSTWILAWSIRPQAPLNLPLANWQPRAFLPISPALLLDSKSWPFIIAMTTLTLAAVITDVARPSTSRSPNYWYDLIAYLILTAFSLLATLSGNLLTLLLSWTLLAGVELILRLSKTQESIQSRSVVLALSLRFAAIGCAIYAGMIAIAGDLPLDFTTIGPQISAILLLAAGINLGVLPTHPPIPQDDPKSAGLTALLRLAPCAPALVLLARVGMVGAPADLESVLLLLAGMALIYGSLAWAGISTAQTGIPFWIISLASLAFAAAVLQQSAASLAWGIATLFAGGVFFLATSRLRGLIVIWLLGLASISALPLSPTWEGAGLYALPFQPLLVIFLLGQGLFLASTLRHVLRLPPTLLGAERWLGVLYFSGLLLLVISHYTVPWFLRFETEGIGQSKMGWIETGISMIAVGLAAVAMPLFISRPRRKPRAIKALVNILELTWLYRIVGSFFRSIERIAAMINSILEGRAGILWTLLALALLVSLFVSLEAGG
jgi:hypothetical protein